MAWLKSDHVKFIQNQVSVSSSYYPNQIVAVRSFKKMFKSIVDASGVAKGFFHSRLKGIDEDQQMSLQ